MVQIALIVLGLFRQQRGASQQAQPKPQTYESVIRALPWEADKSGPLISACPRMRTQGSTLNDIERKSVRIGNLTAIVPTTMMTLNTHFTEAPNLYDGLPRDAKVLYFLTLLEEDQWRKITGDGLTLADCRGNQTAVMQSILPNPFKLGTATVVDQHSYTNSDSTNLQVLTDQERESVKLRVTKDISLQLPLANNQGFTGTSVREDRVKGAKVPLLIDDNGDEFGQHIKIESPNTLKKSQLDLANSRFDVKIPLKDNELPTALVARIAAATGVELYADPHYSTLSMVERGTEASARDLLQALALGVAGTYRRVGNAFVLTCDLEGVAAHQLRIAIFEDDIQKVLNERKDLWRSVIAKGNQLGKVKFSPGAYDKLTPDELANISNNDRPDNSDEKYISTATCSDAIRQAVQNFRGLNLDPSRVGVHSTTEYEFILPGGSKMPFSTGWLDSTNRFSPNPSTWHPPKPAPVSLPMSPPTSLSALVLHADSDKTARSDVDHVHELGVGELWLETQNQAVLAAAIDTATPLGIKVSLAIRPWIASKLPVTDLDQNATGDHGKAFDEKKADYLALAHFWQDNSAYAPATPDQLSPQSPEVAERWSAIESLASAKGLKGVVLLDAYPTGYAMDSSNSSGSYFYSEAVDAFLSYGYSEAQRLAYLRAEKVDPADLESDSMRVNVRLNDAWGKAWTPGQPFQKWQQTKGKWMRASMLSLVNGLAPLGKPILLGGQPAKIHLAPFEQNYLSSWAPGSDLPVSPEDYVGDETAKASDIAVVNIRYDEDLEQINRVATNLVKLLTKSGKPVVLDFSSVPLNKLDATLKTWLKK